MDFEFINLIWVIRLLFPLVVFWFYWRDNSKPKVAPTPIEFVYDRKYLLSVKGGYRNDSEAKSRVMKTMFVEALSSNGSRRSGKSQVSGKKRVGDSSSNQDAVSLESTTRAGGQGQVKTSAAKRATDGVIGGHDTNAGGAAVEDTSGHDRDMRGDMRDGYGMRAAVENTAQPRREAERARDSNIESLVNYLSFNPPTKRLFLPETPPPPPATPAVYNAAECQRKSAKSNEEAISILRGALSFKKVAVAHRLYEQLTQEKLTIKEETFNLMVQLAVAAKDIKAASNFLMKMESAGLCPSVKLLGTVMQLYSQTKTNNKTQSQPQAAVQQPMQPTSWREGDNISTNCGPMTGPFIPQLSPNAAEFYPRQVSNSSAVSYGTLAANTAFAFERKSLSSGDNSMMWNGVDYGAAQMSAHAAEFIPCQTVGVIPDARDLSYVRKRIS